MIILGIDFGDRRIGIAKSDALGMIATGLDTIVWNKQTDKPIQKIKELVEHHNVEKIVMGLPKNMDGSEGERAQKTKAFAQKLQDEIGIELVFWDERLTSKSAHHTMHERGMKTGHQKGYVDRVAACHILQSYLDRS